MTETPLLLKPREVDELLRYPRGRSARLARAGLIQHVRLPDGEIRFERSVVERMLRSSPACVEPGGEHAN